MPDGVVGGISPRKLTTGQSPTQYPDQMSANTTILQTGAGGFARLSTALQALNQASNVVALANAIEYADRDLTVIEGQIATLQGQVSTLQGQVATLQGQVSTLQGQVSTNTNNIATNAGNITTLQGQVSTLQQQAALFQAFQSSFNYLQLEVSTGAIYLDQRTIYRRSFVINGALDTALNVFTYPHNIAAINYIVAVQAMAGAAGGQMLPITFLNMATAPSLSTGISIWADATNIYIAVGTTPFTGIQVLATLWYTATNR